jgi:CHAT domain-containing protein
MGSILTRFFHASSVFIRYTMLKTHPSLTDDSALETLTQHRLNAQSKNDYRTVQSLSEKLCFLQSCRDFGIETTVFGHNHSVDLSIAGDIPEFYGDSLQQIETGDAPVRATEKIQLFTALLNRISRSRQPYLWAELQQKLCAAHLNNRQKNAVDAIHMAIQCGENALLVYKQDIIPVEWARIHSYLGIAWKNHPADSAVNPVENAIWHYEMALAGYPLDSHPVNHAVSMMNLALAYSGRTTGDYAENIERSIELFLASLKVFLKDTFPVNWATTHLNLATVYKKRLSGDNTENNGHMLLHLQQALTVFSADTAPNEWSMIQTNLGNANLDLGLNLLAEKNQEGAQYIDRAVDHYNQVLTVRTRERSPAGWAKVNANLAAAYNARATGSPSENMEAVIRYCRNALSVFTARTSPYEWASTQKNLALALRNRSGKRGGRDLENARRLLSETLAVFSAENFPWERLEILVVLSEIQLEMKQWRQAAGTFEEIRQLDGMLRRQDVTRIAQSRRVRVTGMIYSRAAYCFTRCGQIDRAFEWLEYGKMQLFREQMLSDAFLFQTLREKDRTSYERITAAIRDLTAEQHQAADHLRPLPAIAANIRTARKHLDTLTARIRTYEPAFLQEDMRFADMTGLLPETGDLAIAVFIITRYGSCCHVLSGTPERSELHTFSLGTFRYSDLETLSKQFHRLLKDLGAFQSRLLPRPAELPAFYAEQSRAFADWNKMLKMLAQKLYAALFQELAHYLTSIDIKRLVLVTGKELNILPLHLAHPADNPTTVYLMDRFEISYSPSFTLIRKQSRQSRSSEYRSFAGIADIEGNLTWVRREIDQISRYFDTKNLLTFRDVPGPGSLSNQAGHDILHFSCHAMFDSGDPYNSRLVLSPSCDCKNAPGHHADSVHLQLTDTQGSAGDGSRPSSHEENEWTLVNILRDLRLSGTRLVVLSACESGLIESSRLPDEFIGLPAGFLLAGADTVLSSLWCVPDESAFLLMTNFYENLVRHRQTPARALRNAQQHVRCRPGHHEPLCWGAFKILGM